MTYTTRTFINYSTAYFQGGAYIGHGHEVVLVWYSELIRIPLAKIHS